MARIQPTGCAQELIGYRGLAKETAWFPRVGKRIFHYAEKAGNSPIPGMIRVAWVSKRIDSWRVANALNAVMTV
jgi:hypothetical protein